LFDEYYISKKFPVTVIEELATREYDCKVKEMIASHFDTPITILEKLATDPDNNVRLTN